MDFQSFNFEALYEANKERITTGVIMAVFASCIAIVDSHLLTWVILGVIYGVAFKEVLALFEIKDKRLYTFATVLWLFTYFYPNPDLIYVVLIVILSVMAYNKKATYKALIPFLYPSISMLFIYALYVSFGMKALIWLVFVVAFTDTGAYFVGKSFGKRSFSQTSPNKTLEGVVGGVAVGTMLGFCMGLLVASPFVALVISFATSTASVFGDLFESYLKREAGVKDSGTLFPGHGGMLDRLDGYLFGGVVMMILLRGLL